MCPEDRCPPCSSIALTPVGHYLRASETVSARVTEEPVGITIGHHLQTVESGGKTRREAPAAGAGETHIVG